MLTIAQSSARRLFELGPRIARSIRASMRRLPDSRLTLAQYRILAHVERGLGSASGLCEVQGVSLPAMSRMVETLVRKGLIRRAGHAGDRRKVLLTLSPAGRKAYLGLKTAVVKDLRSRIEGLPPKRLKDLERTLDDLEGLFP